MNVPCGFIMFCYVMLCYVNILRLLIMFLKVAGLSIMLEGRQLFLSGALGIVRASQSEVTFYIVCVYCSFSIPFYVVTLVD